MHQMRHIIQLVEGLRPMPKEMPRFFYHGTNMAAGCMILRDRKILADNPVDDDDLGAVVCVTERAEVGRMFAVEFLRLNSEYPVGVVFTLDAAKVLAAFKAIPYEAETAGFEEEAEYRIKGDIPLTMCTEIRLVGDLTVLTQRKRSMDPKTGEMATMKEQIFYDYRQQFPGGWKEYSHLWAQLVRRASRES